MADRRKGLHQLAQRVERREWILAIVRRDAGVD